MVKRGRRDKGEDRAGKGMSEMGEAGKHWRVNQVVSNSTKKVKQYGVDGKRAGEIGKGSEVGEVGREGRMGRCTGEDKGI